MTECDSKDPTIRLRPDIQWSRLSDGSESTWVARDPISLQFFYFSEFERSISLRLDGHAKLSDILRSEALHGVSEQWLLSLVSKLNSACLTAPQAEHVTGKLLWRARNRIERRKSLHALLSPLAIRIKIFDPTRLLEILNPVAQGLFSKPFVLASVIFTCVIGSKVLIQFTREPGTLDRLFANMSGERAVALLLIYLCVKSLHELGHALACRKWESECHEIGFFFLVFTPCLYCDTTDSWRLTGWKRASIAAAGIYVELLVAAIAGFLWLFSPSVSELHTLAGWTMIMCSASTLLVNANPLLRYDGYYVLSDLWGVPNLHEQSREATRALLVSWLSGIPLRWNRWDKSPLLLAVYGCAAWLYRHLVVVLIIWMVWNLLENLGVRLIGALLVLVTLLSVIAAFALGLIQLLKELYMIGEVRTFRVASFLSAVLLAGLAYLWLPLPTYVTARGFTIYEQMKPIYAPQAGTLTQIINPGAVVTKGIQIAEFQSPELEIQLIETRGEVAALEERSAHLNILSVGLESAYAELATINEQLIDARERLSILKNEFDSLCIFAESDGIFIPAKSNLDPSITELPHRRLHQATLITDKIGCYLVRGTDLGWVCDPGVFQVKALVAEDDAQFLRVGGAVRCRWECDLDKLWRGTVIGIAPDPVSEMPLALIGDQSFVSTYSEGIMKPVLPHFEVIIEFPKWPPTITHQTLATLHFQLPDQTLHEMLKRFLDRNIRFEL